MITLGGIVRQYDLPVAGVVWPGTALSESTFTDPAWVGVALPEPIYWGTRRMAVGSSVFEGGRGAVAADRYALGLSSAYDDAQFLVRGENAGDEFGFAIGRTNLDDHSSEDLVVSAPRSDASDVDAGSVYLLPSAR